MQMRALIAASTLTTLAPLPLFAAVPSPSYAIVVSQPTHTSPDWLQVVNTLQKKHSARVFVYTNSVDETLPALRDLFPRYACFVARPEESSRAFVAQVHRLTRQLNADPYPDCFWGILTGYNASNALSIARHDTPLTVRKVAAGTEVALDKCEEGVWYCELKPGKSVHKEKDQSPQTSQGATDSTAALVATLNDYQADLFVTSGHATESDWQIGYSYKNGYFRCENGQLYGLDTGKRRLPIQSPNPKVYLPIGNCLMGHIDTTNAMALAFMNSAGVHQMIGYTVPTWYGYLGWGCLDYFVEQPGRYSFTEAFFANYAALIHRLETFFPGAATAELDANFRPKTRPAESEAARAAGLRAQDALGLLYDRDTVAFYGDPAWDARMADQPKAFDQSLTQAGGTWTFEIKPRQGTNSFNPVNLNGTQRGGRPFVAWLPHLISRPKLLEGAQWKPVITETFVLVPNPGTCDPAASYRVVFQADMR